MQPDAPALDAILLLALVLAMPACAICFGTWEESRRRRMARAAGNLLVAALATLALFFVTRTKFTYATVPCLLLGASYYFSSLFLARLRYALLAALFVFGYLVVGWNAQLMKTHPTAYHYYRCLYAERPEREALLDRLRASLAARAATDETVLAEGDAFGHPALKPLFDPEGREQVPNRTDVFVLWHTPVTGIYGMNAYRQTLRYPGGKLRDGLPALAFDQVETIAPPED